MASLTGIVPSFQLLRFDVEGERGQLRVQIDSRKAMDSTKLLGQLHGVLPGCDFSLVNLNSTL
jgi:hypothetical protein